MIWKKVSIETNIQAVDILSEFLSENEVEGVVIEDNQPLTEDEIKEMFVDIPLEKDEVNDDAVISFYLDDSFSDDKINELIDKIKEELDRLKEFIPVGSGDISINETSDDTTWNDNFKNYFKPARLYNDLVIMPEWEMDDPENDFVLEESDKIIKIRSVMAFGTGTHETTRLCLGLIKKYIQEMDSEKQDISLMDVGCGSGILSIASVLLGASYVHGLDIDPQAVEASKINAEANDIDEDVLNFSCGNLLAGNLIAESYINEKQIKKAEKASLGSGVSSSLTPEEAARMVDIENGNSDPVPKRTYDIVVANILADVIIPLSAVIGEYLEKDSIFICSGISDSKIDEVIEAVKVNGFDILDHESENEWHALALKK